MEDFKISKFGSRVGTRADGQKAQPEIEAQVKNMPYGNVLVLSLEGMEMVGFSFADEAIALTFQRLISNEYGDKYIIIKGSNPDVLEGIDSALQKKGLSALVIDYKGWKCIGLVKLDLMDILKIIIEKKEISTPNLTESLGKTMTAQNCNNKVMELARLKLIKREKINNPSGGIMYMNKTIV